LILTAVKEPKRRKKTKPSRGARERRLKGKRQRSEIKARRQGRD
jgi:ribosome-associated protein